MISVIFNSNLFSMIYEKYILAHQVNCQARMGSGVALQVKQRFPDVYDAYLKYCQDKEPKDLLGTVQIRHSLYRNTPIANLFGQENYGYDGGKYTSYKAFEMAFNELCSYCKRNKFPGIVVPYKIGCVRGGASWEMIFDIMKRLTTSYCIDLMVVSNESEPEEK